MKQTGLVGGTLPLSTVTPATGERGQPAVEVGPFASVAEVAPNAPSFVLAKRKRDESVGTLGHKKSRVPMSLRALRQAARLTPLSPTKVPSLSLMCQLL